MTRSTFVVVTLASAMLATGAGAEPRPDFSGTWTISAPPDSTGDEGSLGSGWGASFTMVQDADTLTVERVFFARADLQPPLKFRYSLDGAETRNTVMMGRGIQVLVSTTRWEDDKLVITTIHKVPNAGDGQAIESKVTRTVSLRPPSGGRLAWPPSLVVETMRSGVLGGPPSTTRTVYIRN